MSDRPARGPAADGAGLVIYVPAYNAGQTLAQTLDRIPAEFRRHRVLVVNNASTDDTHDVATRYQAHGGLAALEVVTNPRNLGYGGSQKVAYRKALDEGFAVVAMVHADGQYAPELLPQLVTPVRDGGTDLVFGSRIAGDPLKGGMPLHRFLGNRLLTWTQNLLLGLRLSEYHSGYRVFATAALRQVPFERLSDDYHFDTEILILFRHHGLRIAETPIPTHYGDEPNFVNIWKYGLDVLVTTGTYVLHRLGLRRSRNWARILDGAPAGPRA